MSLGVDPEKNRSGRGPTDAPRPSGDPADQRNPNRGGSPALHSADGDLTNVTLEYLKTGCREAIEAIEEYSSGAPKLSHDPNQPPISVEAIEEIQKALAPFNKFFSSLLNDNFINELGGALKSTRTEVEEVLHPLRMILAHADPQSPSNTDAPASSTSCDGNSLSEADLLQLKKFLRALIDEISRVQSPKE